MTEILAILLLAALFVIFGVTRWADRDSGGCHGCSHGDSGDCGDECPLLREAFDREPQPDVWR
jgi:hypothetical protein